MAKLIPATKLKRELTDKEALYIGKKILGYDHEERYKYLKSEDSKDEADSFRKEFIYQVKLMLTDWTDLRMFRCQNIYDLMEMDYIEEEGDVCLLMAVEMINYLYKVKAI